jgi:acetylornithine aminotransferase
MTSKKEVLGAGDHGSTFGGNYLSSTAVCEVVDILNEEKQSGKLDSTIEYFNQKLQEFFESHKDIFSKKVGIGLMCGLRCKDSDTLSKIVSASQKNGVMVLKAGRDTLRLLPALTITKKEIDEGFMALESSVAGL